MILLFYLDYYLYFKPVIFIRNKLTNKSIEDHRKLIVLYLQL